MAAAALTTAFPDDPHRLPEGTHRTGYDADTARYAYTDAAQPGVVLLGAPGEEYGSILPEAAALADRPSRGLGRRPTLPAYDRPVRFAPDDTANAKNASASSDDDDDDDDEEAEEREQADRFAGPAVNGTGLTFADILPAHLLTTAPPIDAKKRHAFGGGHGQGQGRGQGSGHGHERSGSVGSVGSGGGSPSPRKFAFGRHAHEADRDDGADADASKRRSIDRRVDVAYGAHARTSSFRRAAQLVGKAAGAFKSGGGAAGGGRDAGRDAAYVRVE